MMMINLTKKITFLISDHSLKKLRMPMREHLKRSFNSKRLKIIAWYEMHLNENITRIVENRTD